jgi:hypothetical protein
VRKSRFHDPETLSAKELYIDYNLSAGALARDGTKVRDFWWRHKVGGAGRVLALSRRRRSQNKIGKEKLESHGQP